MEKVVYGLYAREDIVHPDGTTGVIYPAGEQVATLTTDENGKASVENLYLGNYFVKEITPSAGYLADETEYDLVCNYEGDLVAIVKKRLPISGTGKEAAISNHQGSEQRKDRCRSFGRCGFYRLSDIFPEKKSRWNL